MMNQYWQRTTSIAPLVTFRILFGGIMAISMLRFVVKGWVQDLYLTPRFFFTYYGFDWIRPLGSGEMYALFIVLILCALGIMFGLFYRVSAIVFFLGFTYVELIDKTNYLNHYYFVSLVAFLLIWLPAHRAYALDAWRQPQLVRSKVPAWTIDLLKAQLALVYFFAGMAKLNPDWLLEAMPLRLWLPALSHLPLIGNFFNHVETAFAFSWFGALYDLSIPFLLWNQRTRPWAYLAVLAFHLMTAMLFQIGMFPYIMVLATLIFFSPTWHQRLLEMLPVSNLSETGSWHKPEFQATQIWRWGIGLYFLVQVLVPLRSHLYPGSVFWHEQGYRFSWRVMLMEKAGYTHFKIVDGKNGREEWVNNQDHLTAQQEKMMSTQPDMILQFAHYLRKIYEEKGFAQPEVYCYSKVTLNGRRSTTFVNTETNLASINRTLSPINWIESPKI